MGRHRLVEKVLTGVQFGTAYADEIRAIPYQRAGPIVLFTAASTPVLSARNSGTLFVKTETGVTTILLPSPVLSSGVYWDFFNNVNANMILDGALDDVVGYGADQNIQIIQSVVNLDRIGWGIRVISDGTQYFWQLNLAEENQTVAKVS